MAFGIKMIMIKFHTVYVLWQTLCILTNVADGDEAKEYIMGNEDVLKKLMAYMVSIDCMLQKELPYILVYGMLEEHSPVKHIVADDRNFPNDMQGFLSYWKEMPGTQFSSDRDSSADIKMYKSVFIFGYGVSWCFDILNLWYFPF